MKPEIWARNILIGVGIYIVLAIIYSCTKTPETIVKEIPVSVVDTLKLNEYVEKINKLNKELAIKKSVVARANDSILILNNKVDSLVRVNRNLKDDLLAAKYKIERVRYYNDIAKNGNNIKFLRGWINRALKD